MRRSDRSKTISWLVVIAPEVRKTAHAYRSNEVYSVCGHETGSVLEQAPKRARRCVGCKKVLSDGHSMGPWLVRIETADTHRVLFTVEKDEAAVTKFVDQFYSLFPDCPPIVAARLLDASPDARPPWLARPTIEPDRRKRRKARS